MSTTGACENLRPFKKGQSGNPGGRPNGPSVAKCLARVLQGRVDEVFEPGTRAEAVAYRLYERAMGSGSGAVTALRTILERVDGVVPRDVVAVDARSPLERYEDEHGEIGPEGGPITKAAARLDGGLSRPGQ